MPEFDVVTEQEEVSPTELEFAKRLVQLLSNALKSLLIYPSNNPLPKEFKRKLHQSLSEFLDSHDELNLQVSPSRLLYQGKMVYEDGEKEKGVAYILHKDGVRELAFLKGLEFEEIEDLLEVMDTCLRSTDLDEDLVTMCWEKDFNHIKYLVVDDLLDVDVPSAEDVPDNWDFDRLFHSEVALPEQETTSPGVDRLDLIRKTREEQTQRLLSQLKEFSPEEVRSIQKLLETDSRRGSLDQFLVILNEILVAEQDLSEFNMIMEAVEKIVVTLITMADFHSAAKIVRGLRSFRKTIQKQSEKPDSLKRSKAERTRRSIDEAGDEEHLQTISRIVNEREITEFSSVKEYLFSLNWKSISPMMHMYGDLKSFLARRMVSDVLAEKAKDHLELLGEGISDQRWYVVRNVVSVIGAIGSEEGVRFLKQIVRHRDLRVRKEIVSSLLKIPGVQAGLILVSFLEDEDKGIRILASRGLAQRKEEQALPALKTILEDDQFKDESADVKKHMLESFAAIAGGQAVSFLAKMVNKRGWLKRDKHNETRIFAVGALSTIEAPEAKEALLKLSKKRNRVIRRACQQALRRIEYRRMRNGKTVGVA